MSRPLRIEFEGAVYHVTSRGNRRESIFLDDADRLALLDVIGRAMERFDAAMLAFCLMGNHYHFVLRTRRANLSQVMRHINGVYTQAFNRRHGKVGHVFQGRFKAILVDSDSYLVSVCRYVELNPVRAGLVDDPSSWRWSSCPAQLGLTEVPPWLDSAALLGQLIGRPVVSDEDWRTAHRRHAELLASERDTPLWPQALRQQIYLGEQAFVERMQDQARQRQLATGTTAQTAGSPVRRADIPREQQRPPLRLQHWLDAGPTRELALRRAHVDGGLSLTAMARELGLSVSRVSRLVARADPSGTRTNKRAKGKT